MRLKHGQIKIIADKRKSKILTKLHNFRFSDLTLEQLEDIVKIIECD